MFKSMMLAAAAVAMISTACAATKVAYVETGVSRFEEFKKFDETSNAPTTVVGMLIPDDPTKLAKTGQLVGWAYDLSLGYAESDDVVESTNLRIDRLYATSAGRYYFDTGTRFVQPYLGLGVRAQHLHAETGAGDAEDDFRFGVVPTIGVDIGLTKALRLSARYERTVGMDCSLGEQSDINLDTESFLFGLGWSF